MCPQHSPKTNDVHQFGSAVPRAEFSAWLTTLARIRRVVLFLRRRHGARTGHTVVSSPQPPVASRALLRTNEQMVAPATVPARGGNYAGHPWKAPEAFRWTRIPDQPTDSKFITPP